MKNPPLIPSLVAVVVLAVVHVLSQGDVTLIHSIREVVAFGVVVLGAGLALAPDQNRSAPLSKDRHGPAHDDFDISA